MVGATTTTPGNGEVEIGDSDGIADTTIVSEDLNKDKLVNNNRLPMVIKSMIISYLSFRSYLTIMRLNHSWQVAALRNESKCPHLQAASFMIKVTHTYGWYSRLRPFSPRH
jgi:uncharacterized protein YqkB